MTVGAPSYKGFRFPAEIISHCVWLYHRFSLSFREIEEMMLKRGIVVSHETVRQWCAKFGQTYANGLRRRRARPGDKWHLDEVFIKINGTIHYLWRAVDQHGDGHCQVDAEEDQIFISHCKMSTVRRAKYLHLVFASAK